MLSTNPPLHQFFQQALPLSVCEPVEMTFSSCVESLEIEASRTIGKTAKMVYMIGGTMYTIRCQFALSGEKVLIIKHVIGQGNFKIVKQIVDVANRTVFARAKIIAWKHLEQAKLTQMVRSLEAECSFMILCQQSQIRHIPRLLSKRMSEDKMIGFDVEYCSEGDAEKLVRTPPFSRNEVKKRLYLLKDVAEAVSDLHALHLGHNDLKPKNILLTTIRQRETEAKIGDFGGIGRIGTPILQSNFFFSDYETRQALQQGTAVTSTANNVWSIGMLIFNFLYGESENPICSLMEEVPSKVDWEAACHQISAKLILENPLDQLISSILCAQKEEWPSAAVIATTLQEICQAFD